MNKKAFKTIFVVFTILAIATLIFHIVGIFHPTEKSPAGRHAIFIAISIISIYGLMRRPKWFIGLVALLTLQQWYSHGSYLIELWQAESRIHWISLADILLMLALFIFLILEHKTTATGSTNAVRS